jgi:AraC-like DNA-binding protein
MLYPTDLAMIHPGQELMAGKGYLEIGAFMWLSLEIDCKAKAGKNIPAGWNTLIARESAPLQKILFCNNSPVILQLKEAGTLLSIIRNEIFGQEIGYITRVHQMINEMLILITRKLTRQHISHRDFPKTFLTLEESLRKNLFHHWTVEEMATLVGLGTTAFSDKVKSYTGFTPMNYLINLRISESIKLLKRPEVNMTDIALVTGFYSSQHFSTTFKKLTGYTPSQFRKNSITKL